MLVKILNIIALVSMILCALLMATSSAHETIGDRIRESYTRQCASIVAGKLGVYRATLATEFVAVNPPNVIVDRDQMLVQVAKQPIKYTECTTFVQKLVTSDGIAFVFVKQRLDGFVSVGSFRRPTVLESMSADIWRDRGDGLVELSSVTIAGSVRINDRIVRRVP